MRNFYQDLDLPNFATKDEIKAQYRRLAKEFHPDRYSGNPDRFKQMSEAYRTLSDDDNKRRYDTQLQDMFSNYQKSQDQNNTSSDIWSFFTKKAMNVAENYVKNVAEEFIEETEEYSPLVQETVDVTNRKNNSGSISCTVKISAKSLHKILVACSKGENLEQYCLEIGEIVAGEMYDNIMKNWEN